MIKQVLLGAVALGLASAAGAATTITAYPAPDVGPLPGQTLYDDFSTAAHLSGTYSLTSGSIPGEAAAPGGDTTQYLSVSVGQAAVLDLGKGVKDLSFFWGSIDNYNQVSFFNGLTLVSTFGGGAVPGAPADGNQNAATNNKRVNFDFGGAVVTTVLFTSSRPAFEIDDVALGAIVPEPATWAMLVSGFGLVGVASRRRRDSAKSVAA